LAAAVTDTPFVRLVNGRQFAARADASLLDEAARAGLALQHSCRSGRCGVCRATLVSGDTRALRPELALEAAEIERRVILTCCRAATTDLELDIEDLGRLAGITTQTLPCRIASLKRLAPEVMAVTLRIPPTESFDYLPGQYLNLTHGSIERSYSIANAQRADRTLDLFIRRVPGGALSRYWFDEARVNDLLRFRGPLGTFFLRESPPGPEVFLATGTGIAPIRALVEERQRLGPTQAMHLYWGNRTSGDFFVSFPPMPGLQIHRVLSRPHPRWDERRGHVQTALLEDLRDLSAATVYASGSPAMIEEARITLGRHGLPGHRFFADPFLVSG
jgi:CDP-4-dehydro-6-deoxyglucose reductase